MPRKTKIFACPHEGCSAKFKRSDRYESHMRVHTGERPYICSYDDCDKSYTRVSHLRRHEESHEECNIRCTVSGCTEVLKTKATLKKHIDIVHENKNKKYKCAFCNKVFTKHKHLKVHEYQHTNIKPYSCPHEGCDKAFLFPSRLKTHLKIHSGYKCGRPECGEVLSSWSLYLKHSKVYHPTLHQCPICNRIFSTSSNLIAHQSLHASERPVFHCSKANCPKFYFAKRNLAFHIKSYHDKRPFVCNEENCHREYKTEVELNAHKRYHDPNIPLSPKKKRKRKSSKPTFAARLAGCVERKRRKITPISEDESISPELSPNSVASNASEETMQSSATTETGEMHVESEKNNSTEHSASEIFKSIICSGGSSDLDSENNNSVTDLDKPSSARNNNFDLPNVERESNAKEHTALEIFESILNGCQPSDSDSENKKSLTNIDKCNSKESNCFDLSSAKSKNHSAEEHSAVEIFESILNGGGPSDLDSEITTTGQISETKKISAMDKNNNSVAKFDKPNNGESNNFNL